VLVPSHALGVNSGASMSVKPPSSKNERMAWMIVWRTRMIAC
jgi:hypothetical protein